ncbi:MAG: hypothetical protein AAF982_11860 [Pseudomonadota bacterium]
MSGPSTPVGASIGGMDMPFDLANVTDTRGGMIGEIEPVGLAFGPHDPGAYGVAEPVIDSAFHLDLGDVRVDRDVCARPAGMRPRLPFAAATVGISQVAATPTMRHEQGVGIKSALR